MLSDGDSRQRYTASIEGWLSRLTEEWTPLRPDLSDGDVKSLQRLVNSGAVTVRVWLSGIAEVCDGRFERREWCLRVTGLIVHGESMAENEYVQRLVDDHQIPSGWCTESADGTISLTNRVSFRFGDFTHARLSEVGVRAKNALTGIDSAGVWAADVHIRQNDQYPGEMTVERREDGHAKDLGDHRVFTGGAEPMPDPLPPPVVPGEGRRRVGAPLKNALRYGIRDLAKELRKTDSMVGPAKIRDEWNKRHPGEKEITDNQVKHYLKK
jgi:hypothetical protein